MKTDVVNEESNSAEIVPSRPPRRVGGYLALCYIFLICFFVVVADVHRMSPLSLGLSTLVFSAPTMIALWHQGTVRRLAGLHQFEVGRALRRWGSMRAIGILVRAAAAVVLTAMVMLQSFFFDTLEWSLFFLAPLIFLAVRSVIEATTSQQFSARVYAQRWLLWATECSVILLLSVIWIGARWAAMEAPAVPYIDRVYELQSEWTGASSSIVRTLLDLSAWGQAAIEILGAASEERVWQLPVALITSPVSIFGFLVLTLSGFSLPLVEIKRTLGEHLTADDVPPPVGAARAAVWSAIGTIGVVIFFQSLGAGDHRLGLLGSPFALAPRPDCERIGGNVYKVGAIELLKAQELEVERRIEVHQGEVCRKLSEVASVAEQGIDQYLDWYFSLGGDWARTFAMLGGDGGVEGFMEGKFNELVSPIYAHLLQQIQVGYEQQWSQLVAGRASIYQVLEQNRLILTEGQCNVVAEGLADPMSVRFDHHKTRLLSGAGSGLVAGTFAASVTAKAMSKATMKSAGKVLVKAAAKKAVGKAGGALAGAVAGSVVPGVGTVVGALIGAGVGLAVGTTVDIALLAREESLTRDDMKKELLAAVTESLESHRKTFACR